MSEQVLTWDEYQAYAEAHKGERFSFMVSVPEMHAVPIRITVDPNLPKERRGVTIDNRVFIPYGHLCDE